MNIITRFSFYPLDFLTMTYPGVQPEDFAFVFVANLEEKQIIKMFSCALESNEFDWSSFDYTQAYAEIHPIDISKMDQMELKYLYQYMIEERKPSNFTSDVKSYLTKTKNKREGIE